jgi:SIT4-associating protein SAP185/190
MLWKFSFASGSTLESLFTRETPPSVEEVMDETDILSECKAQNQRYIHKSVG